MVHSVNEAEYNGRRALDYALALMDQKMLDCLDSHGARYSGNHGIRLIRRGKQDTSTTKYDSVPIDHTAAVWCGSKSEASNKRIQRNQDRAFQPPPLMVEEIEKETCKSIAAYHWVQEEARMSRTPIPVNMQIEIGMTPRREFASPPIWTLDRTPYEILGIADHERSDIALIRNRCREKALQVHPDRQHAQRGQEEKDAAALFHEINDTYAILRDPERKSQYDSEQLSAGESDSSWGSLLVKPELEYACVPPQLIRQLNLNQRRRKPPDNELSGLQTQTM
jgi:hypothetical protein